MTPTVTVIIPCGPMAYPLLVRCLSRLNRKLCDEIVFSRFDASHVVVQHDDVPVKEIAVPYCPDIARVLTKRAFDAATSEWVWLLYVNEWLVTDGWQVNDVQKMVTPGEDRLPMRLSVRDTLASVPSTTAVISCPMVLTEDEHFQVRREFRLEGRFIRHAAGFQFDGQSFVGGTVIAAHLPIASQPYPAFFYNSGDAHTAMRLAGENRIERRYRTLARGEISKREARAALWTLFEHMSSHEELWRLGELLKHLPYTLAEDEPFMREVTAAYAKQMQHLAGGAENWYRDGSFSPMHTIDAAYIELGVKALPHRCKWLLNECRERGYQRIVELGSGPGANLFPLRAATSDLEVHGVEISPEAVKLGTEMAEQRGFKLNLHCDSFAGFADKNNTPFDAAAVFEVLEHNSPDEGRAILRAAEACVRPGGRVFITTPCGAWSLHDETCWDLTKRKDHVNAYTIERMKAFLSEFKDAQVQRVENPSYEEANAWVYASYEVGS